MYSRILHFCLNVCLRLSPGTVGGAPLEWSWSPCCCQTCRLLLCGIIGHCLKKRWHDSHCICWIIVWRNHVVRSTSLRLIYVAKLEQLHVLVECSPCCVIARLTIKRIIGWFQYISGSFWPNVGSTARNLKENVVKCVLVNSKWLPKIHYLQYALLTFLKPWLYWTVILITNWQ